MYCLGNIIPRVQRGRPKQKHEKNKNKKKEYQLQRVPTAAKVDWLYNLLENDNEIVMLV